MNTRNIIHFFFMPASLLIGAILISQTALANSAPSAGNVNNFTANKTNCLQQRTIAVTKKIAIPAVESAACSENSEATGSFILIASTSIYLIQETEPTLHQLTTAVNPIDLLLHFMIAITMVVLMFRTQIMEWELLRWNRTFDSS